MSLRGLAGEESKTKFEICAKLANRKSRFPPEIRKPEVDKYEDSRHKYESGQLILKSETSQKRKEKHYLTSSGNYLNSSLPRSAGGILDRFPREDERNSIDDDRGCFP